jgi:hypothetical protein
MRTKIRVKKGHKLIWGKWYFGGDELIVDLRSTDIENQRPFFDIIDPNLEKPVVDDKPATQKEVATDIIKNRMVNKKDTKTKRK